MTKSEIRRYRAWAFILYPEDIPDNIDWYVKLDELHVPIAISPIHDMDYDDNHNLKKIHYHVILSFDGKKSADQVFELLLDSLSPNGEDNFGFTRPQYINCLASYYRYLCHLDSDDKVKYDPEGICLLGGFNPHKYIDEQSQLFIVQMCKYIEEHDYTEFALFDSYCLANYPDTWHRILMRNYGYFSTLIRSRRHMKEGR